MNILLFAALTGCAPDHADVDGDWFAWLAAGSSPTIQEDELSMGDATIFECSGRGWDADTCMFDPGYIGPNMGGFSDSDEFIGGACAQMNDAGNYNLTTASVTAPTPRTAPPRTSQPSRRVRRNPQPREEPLDH